ncbi:MAG: hypothetical protein IMY84_03625 [Chloroflexi bacterium]|nr:hypothetical protein [Chloroflexota bacterium]
MSKTGPGLVDRLRIRVRRALGLNIVLCDRCKWNWRSACHRRERPNAIWCPDFTRKGS